MGIHAKYNLTLYAFQNIPPQTYYGECDFYEVAAYDTLSDCESIHRYNEWREVRSFITHMNEDEFYEEWNFVITGIVCN